MKLLHGFARGEGTATQKTVLATIHQPSEEVFNLFDKVPGIAGMPGGILIDFASEHGNELSGDGDYKSNLEIGF